MVIITDMETGDFPDSGQRGSAVRYAGCEAGRTGMPDDPARAVYVEPALQEVIPERGRDSEADIARHLAFRASLRVMEDC